MKLIDFDSQEELLRFSSHLTTAAADERQVEVNARALADWVTAVGSPKDVERRMAALRQVCTNLIRIDKMPMDDVEELTGKAACFYVFLGGDPGLVAGPSAVRLPDDAPPVLIEAVGDDGEMAYIACELPGN